MSQYHYYQINGGEEAWRPSPAVNRENLEQQDRPMFITVLAVSRIIDETNDDTKLSYEEKLNLAYDGPLYFDWDSEDEGLVIEKVNDFLDKLVEMRVDLDQCRLYATGGRGYHLEIPPKLFMDKMPPKGTVALPSIYREVALAMCVDTLDLRVYSGGRGRMWRVPNVKRPNGRYKVSITVAEMRSMTPELCVELTSSPRAQVPVKAPVYTPDLAVAFDAAKQKVDALVKARKKYKPDPDAAKRARADSVLMAMGGVGLRAGVGFQDISIQLAVAAVTAGMTEDQFVIDCEGLIENHVSDSKRYNTTAKRIEQLRRLYRYMQGNMFYEFSIGAFKSILSHTAPDLDGIAVTRDDIVQEIKEAETAETTEMDEYKDVAKGISLSRFGVYKEVEGIKRRICAISFADSVVLMSMETNQIVGYETGILVNGAPRGRQMMEIEVLSSLNAFTRLAAKYGHAFQGNDADVRTMMMRFVEQTKKKGTFMYVTNREGLDVLSIPTHENDAYRLPFLVWSDHNGVQAQASLEAAGAKFSYQGYPDPTGVFKTDLAHAPNLVEWLEEGDNRAALRVTLENLMSCQKPELLGKLLGWHVSCFWKQLFHRVYGKFPLLHINGAAGVGKCLGKDTPVLMADGTIKLVQDVKVGDKLLGPDGGVRNVLSLARGREELYRIDPVKGSPYVVNASHILSLKKSEARGINLADGTNIPADADVVNVNVEVFASSNKAARKSLKGWRSDAVEFNRRNPAKLLDPYALGLWLGDGRAVEPSICKPEITKAVQWWKRYAKSLGCEVSRYMYRDIDCPVFYIKKGPAQDRNPVWDALEHYNLFDNKHVPADYKYASVAERRALIAGMLDSDGHLEHSNYDWISSSERLAEDFAFLCRSVGLACYIKPVKKNILSRNFEGDYWRCCVSGDTHLLPCLDKKAEPRRQVKRVTVTGIDVVPLGVGDYYGFTIDGDHLFMLGDFTVTHNTETTILMSSLFNYLEEPRPTSPSSTMFAMMQQMTSSASIPLIIDEYKPIEMKIEQHHRMKQIFRDAYNQRTISRGGGSRESDDYRSLHSSELSAPVIFIAEAAEDEAAVMERVVLATFSRPPSIVGLKNLAKFQHVRQHHCQLGIIGQYIAAGILRRASLEDFRAEFDAMYEVAKEKYLLNEKDLEPGALTPEELLNKQNAKERSVYNHTVAKFGFVQWRRLVNEIFKDEELDTLMEELEGGIYTRLSDLNGATTPEHIKVLQEIAQMSHLVDDESPMAVRLGMEYAFVQHGSRSCIEIAVGSAYGRYRLYCKSQDIRPFFQNKEGFMHSIRDSPTFVKHGIGDVLELPLIYTFDLEELAKFGVNPFKSK